MMRNDYVIVLDEGEAFIWLHWAGLPASTHAEIVLVHLWRGYVVTEWMSWLLPRSVGSNGCSISECFGCASSKFANLCITNLPQKQLPYAFEVHLDPCFSRFGLQWIKFYLPCGFLLVPTIAHDQSEDSCAHLVVI